MIPWDTCKFSKYVDKPTIQNATEIKFLPRPNQVTPFLISCFTVSIGCSYCQFFL